MAPLIARNGFLLPLVRANTFAKPLPNMLAGIHDARHKGHADSLHDSYNGHPNVYCTDAACYPPSPSHSHFAVCAVAGSGRIAASATISSPKSEATEEAAIALAMLNPDVRVMVSDSKQVITNFPRGRVASSSLYLLPPLPSRTSIPSNWCWFRLTRAIRGMRQPTLLLEVLSTEKRGNTIEHTSKP